MTLEYVVVGAVWGFIILALWYAIRKITPF
jgi:hypothetical protein